MLADAIVEATETGSTLRANRLRILDTVTESNTQLIANQTRDGRRVEANQDREHRAAAKAAIEAQGRVGLMLNVQQTEPAVDPGAAAGAAAADDLVAQRSGLGRGEHHHRGAHRARPDPEAQGRGRAGDRRVSAEQDRAVRARRTRRQGCTKGRTKDRYASFHRRTSKAVAALLSAARLRDAATERRDGADRRRRAGGRRPGAAEYARALDGLDRAARDPARASGRRRRDALPARVRASDPARGRAHPSRRAGAGAARLPSRGGRRHQRRAARHPARSRRLLRAGRPLSAALVAADDGDSGARRRRRE